MSVSGVTSSSIGAAGVTNHVNHTQQGESEFSKQVMKCVAVGGKKTLLCSDALYSSANPKTGESVNIYRAEGYSKNNPVYIVKGLDSQGKEFEQQINAGTIDANRCSYNELLVLNLETGHASDRDRLYAAMTRDKAGANSIFEKRDYLSYIQSVMQDQKNLGNMASYWALDTWRTDLLDYISKGSIGSLLGLQ